MNRLPIFNDQYDINDKDTKGALINWLKSRLFVLTIYKLFQLPQYHIHAATNGKKETIKQTFYTFLKLQGKLRCQTKNTEYDYLLFFYPYAST